MIRNAREELGLYLKDLSEQNLSFNLLSNIEKNKTKLTKQKAIMLYKRILVYSWDKKIFPEVEFDEVLKDSEEYKLLRHTHKVCNTLQRRIEEKDVLTKEELRMYRELASDERLGGLSYHLYTFISQLIPEDWTTDRLNVYHETLDFLKWYNFEDNIEKFRHVLSKTLKLSSDLNRLIETIRYYEIMIEAMEIHWFKVDINAYFNLSVCCKRVGDYEKSLKYIKLYRQLKPNLLLKDSAEIILMEAIAHSNLGQFDTSLDLYKELGQRLEDEGLEELEAICYANSLHTIYNNQLTDKVDLVNDYLKKLIALEEIEEDGFNDQIYSSIGQGYNLIYQYVNSYVYFKKALASAERDTDKLDVIGEAFDTYQRLDKVKELFDLIASIDAGVLSVEDVNLLYHILIEMLLLDDDKRAGIDDAVIKGILKKVGRK